MRLTGWRQGLLLVVMLALLGTVWGWLSDGDLQAMADALVTLVGRLEFMAAPVWVCVFALLATFFFPVGILSVASGALFGVAWGTLCTLLGATAAATLSMLLGRRLFSERLESHIGPRAGALRQRVDEEGWRFVAFTRVVPLLPFALLNYSFGLTRIRLLPYALTTFVFMLPARWAYAYAGDVGWGIFREQFGVYRPWLLGLALMMTLVYGGWLLTKTSTKSEEP